MKQILLATDFSKSAKRAIAYALDCFKGIPVTYHLVYISECKGNNTKNTMGTPCQGESCGLKQELLQQAAKAMNAQLDLKLQHCVAHYKNLSKVEALRKHTTEHHIDLIIIGNKGQTNNPKVAIGTFARDILMRVQCSFLMIPEGVENSQPKKGLFPTNYNNVYHNASLNTLSDFMATRLMELDVLYFSKLGRALDKTQQENKELLEGFLDSNHSPPIKTPHRKLENAIQHYLMKNRADVLILMAKNRGFCERLLQRNTPDQQEIMRNLPLLLLHE